MLRSSAAAAVALPADAGNRRSDSEQLDAAIPLAEMLAVHVHHQARERRNVLDGFHHVQ